MTPARTREAARLIEWKAERRITRGKGDTEKKEPRALHKAAWVHVCTAD
jgi:hypothetical protein